MEYITAGDVRMPALGLGTYRLRGQACTDTVSEALDPGYRHIDTAEYYDDQGSIAPRPRWWRRVDSYRIRDKFSRPDHAAVSLRVWPRSVPLRVQPAVGRCLVTESTGRHWE